jgi:glycosyltransferase involved in cell wall biosynthesis
MLSICFYDHIDWDYDVSTPLLRPLGGSQSALCYVAVELARRGHSVVLFNRGRAQRVISGVECVFNDDRPPGDYFRENQFDVVVVLNGPAVMSSLRFDLPARTMLALWTQHAFDQPWMAPLARRNIRKNWDRIICVSDWHRQTMTEAFRLEPERVEVQRNAIGPSFERLFIDRVELAAAKKGEVRLAYSSTPGRGLDLLLDIFPRLGEACSLDVYSSMRVYQVDETHDGFRPLYEQARRSANVSYIGSLGQSELAARFRRTSILSYPNTYAETSCITVMEALAAGLAVVTSDLGALPETAMGFAELIPFGTDTKQDFGERYLERLRSAVQRFSESREAVSERLFDQVKRVNTECTWRVRAAEWERMLMRWKTEAG